MAVARRAAGTLATAATATSIAPAWPTNAVGDIALMAVSSTGTVSTPSGWTLVNSSTTATNHLYVFWRTVPSVQSGTVSVTTTSSTSKAEINSYSGAAQTSPTGSTVTTVTQTNSAAVAGASTTYAGGFVYWAISANGAITQSGEASAAGSWVPSEATDTNAATPSLTVVDGPITDGTTTTLSSTGSASAARVNITVPLQLLTVTTTGSVGADARVDGYPEVAATVAANAGLTATASSFAVTPLPYSTGWEPVTAAFYDFETDVGGFVADRAAQTPVIGTPPTAYSGSSGSNALELISDGSSPGDQVRAPLTSGASGDSWAFAGGAYVPVGQPLPLAIIAAVAGVNRGVPPATTGSWYSWQTVPARAGAAPASVFLSANYATAPAAGSYLYIDAFRVLHWAQDGWAGNGTISINGSKRSGAYSLYLQNGSATATHSRTIAGLTVGTSYTVTVWARAESSSYNPSVALAVTGLSSTAQTISDTSSASWVQLSYTFTATDVTHEVALSTTSSGGLGAYFDDFFFDVTPTGTTAHVDANAQLAATALTQLSTTAHVDSNAQLAATALTELTTTGHVDANAQLTATAVTDAPVAGGHAKAYSSGSFDIYPAKVYNGSAFVTGVAKYWDGTQWQLVGS